MRDRDPKRCRSNTPSLRRGPTDPVPGSNSTASTSLIAGRACTESVPEKLLVVGAGYIGMELSTVFAKLGADVTVVEMLDDALPGYEDDIARVVRKRAAELGIDFHFGEAADNWDETDEGIASRPLTKTRWSLSTTPRNVLSRSAASRSRIHSRWITSTSRRTRTASFRQTTSAERR